MSSEPTPLAIAQALFERDQASQHMGMVIIDVRLGWAKMQMTVEDRHLNGHAVCHGGLIFMLADSTFAFACNAYNQNTLAYACDIVFTKAVPKGSVLTAIAQEQYRKGRNGVYDITIEDQHNQVVSLFRGRSRSIKGYVIEPT